MFIKKKSTYKWIWAVQGSTGSYEAIRRGGEWGKLKEGEEGDREARGAITKRGRVAWERKQRRQVMVGRERWTECLEDGLGLGCRDVQDSPRQMTSRFTLLALEKQPRQQVIRAISN